MIEKLSVRTPPGEVKLKVLKEIAKEHQIDWDTTESETELLKPPEELIVRFVSWFSLLSSHALSQVLIDDLALSLLSGRATCFCQRQQPTSETFFKCVSGIKSASY